MGQTVVEKIVQRHLVHTDAERERDARPVQTGDFVTVRPKHVMTHDNTAAVIKKFRAIGAARVRDPRQPVFALDHDIQNRTKTNLDKYEAIRAFAEEQGVVFHPAGEGIGHQLMIERGFVTPGALVVASDSHSNIYGAVGALGTPVVRTDAAAIWATGEFWWQVPRTVQVVLENELRPGVYGKDVILALCGVYNEGEALNAAVEFTGPGVTTLSMAARMSIANMTTEWGALVGWFPVDEKTVAYYEDRRTILSERGLDRISAEDIASWRDRPIGPDPDATYAARITLDLARVAPCVSGPHSVQRMTPVAELAPRGLKVNKAYIVSCVNSRAEDLAEAARVLRGHRVADGVELYVAAASREVEEAARASGDWEAIIEAGAIPLPPSCGPCIGLGTGLLEAGEVGISATNRNFRGRMGSRDAEAYLASPAVVAASAIAGVITSPDEVPSAPLARHIEALTEKFTTPDGEPPEAVEIIDGFPAELSGRLVFLPPDNINTDGIYGKDYTYREDMTREAMARVVMENYDPAFAKATREGDVLVGGFNFGTGSSREQAVTALQAKGLPVVVAGSFSQTYLRNAFNNGFPCVIAPALVERLREQLASAIEEGERSVIPNAETGGETIAIDYRRSIITWRGETFPFAALGRVPQSLVVAGGVENLVRERLGL